MLACDPAFPLRWPETPLKKWTQTHPRSFCFLSSIWSAWPKTMNTQENTNSQVPLNWSPGDWVFYKLKTKNKDWQHSTLIGHQSLILHVPGRNCDKQGKALLVITPGSLQNIAVFFQKDPDVWGLNLYASLRLRNFATFPLCHLKFFPCLLIWGHCFLNFSGFFSCISSTNFPSHPLCNLASLTFPSAFRMSLHLCMPHSEVSPSHPDVGLSVLLGLVVNVVSFSFGAVEGHSLL